MRSLLALAALVPWFTTAQVAQPEVDLLALERDVAAAHSAVPIAADRGLLTLRLESHLRAAAAAGDLKRAHKLSALMAQSGNDPEWRHPFTAAAATRRLQLPQPDGHCVEAHSIDVGESLQIDHLQRADATDIWFGFVAPEAGLYVVSSIGSLGDSRLDLWQTCGLRPGELLGSNDDYYGLHAALALRAERAGQRFAIRFRNEGRLRSDRLTVISGGFEISGQVTTALPPQTSIRVSAQSEDGSWQGDAMVNAADGRYSLVISSNTRVALRTTMFSNPAGLLTLAHPDQGCLDAGGFLLSGCGDPASWSQFDPAQAPHADVDFHLPLGAKLGGLMIDRQTGAPLELGLASIRIVGTEHVRTAWTDDIGRYLIDGLPEYDYTIEASSVGYVRQLHQNIACPGNLCDPTLGTAVSPQTAAVTAVSFQLDPSARLHVNVTGVPPSELVTARMLDAAGNSTINATAQADQSGLARISVDQAPGAFRFYILGQLIVSQLYPDLTCSSFFCPGQTTDGALLQMPENGELELSMQAVMRPWLRGRIVDAADASPIVDATVSVFGEAFGNTVTDAAGGYALRQHPGDYLLRVTAPRHIDEAYPDVPCQGVPIHDCPAAQTITLGPVDIDGLDMDLDLGGVIRGTISTDPQIPPMTPYGIVLFDVTTGGIISLTSLDGRYAIHDLLPGEYRIGMTGGSFGTFPLYPMLYDGVYCDRWSSGQATFTNCSGPGDIVEVAIAAVTDDIDFLGYYSDMRAVRVARGDTLEPLPGVVVDMWTSTGDYIDAAVTNAAGVVLVGAFAAQTGSPSDFLISTSNALGLVDEVYDDIACPDGPAFFGLCSLAGATPISNWSPAPGSPPLHIRLLPEGSDALWADGFEN